MVRGVFANTTSWSRKARDHLLSDSSDLFFAAESHVIGEQASQAAREGITRCGWTPRAAPAQRSDFPVIGTRGGLLAGARSHLKQSSLRADAVEPFGVVSPFRNLVGIQLS